MSEPTMTCPGCRITRTVSEWDKKVIGPSYLIANYQGKYRRWRRNAKSKTGYEFACRDCSHYADSLVPSILDAILEAPMRRPLAPLSERRHPQVAQRQRREAKDLVMWEFKSPSAETPLIEEIPVRLCCFERHWGPVCPDGKVMCQLCFERFEIKDLYQNGPDGLPEDVCKRCAELDKLYGISILHRLLVKVRLLKAREAYHQRLQANW